MAGHVHTEGPIWALDWLCTIVGLVLLTVWILSANELSLLVGLGFFILGCALKSHWQAKQLKDDMRVVNKELS